MLNNYKKDYKNNYNFRSRSYGHYPKEVIRDSHDSNNISDGGHMFCKTFQEGDDKLLLEPHRDCSGIFLYKRYKQYTHNGSALLRRCPCNHYGELCQYCIVLNTSDFYGLEVPLNPEDWGKMKDFFLKNQKWTEKYLYYWLLFWIKKIEDRWSSKKRLIFFSYDKFFRMNTHAFFYYMCKFIIDEKVLAYDPPRHKPCKVDKDGHVVKYPTQQIALHECRAIITCDAMIRLSFRIYKKGGHITSTTTIPSYRGGGKSIIRYSNHIDPMNDVFEIRKKADAIQKRHMWKRVFQYTKDEIDNEVRWRPGMCGADQCKSSFQRGAIGLMSSSR